MVLEPWWWVQRLWEKKERNMTTDVLKRHVDEPAIDYAPSYFACMLVCEPYRMYSMFIHTHIHIHMPQVSKLQVTVQKLQVTFKRFQYI